MNKARLSVIAGGAVVAVAAVTAAVIGMTSAPPARAVHTRAQAAVEPTPATRATPATPPTQSPAPGVLVATAGGATVAAHVQPDGAVASAWTNPQPQGVPLTFLVVAQSGDWLQVELPQRPNGSTGWIKSADVTLSRVTYRLVASTEQNTLTLFNNDSPVQTYSVATGTGGTPTPHGSFYLTELLAPTNSGYGPYAFGLSAYSDALSSFGGGPGQIGLHGTDDAGSIGHSASHGCIRLANPDITALAHILPLGTPITIE